MSEAKQNERMVSNMPFKEVFAAISEQMDDCSWWRIVGFTTQPKGDRQPTDPEECELFDHEYVDQHSTGIEGDSYAGSVYLPVGNGEYAEVEYCC